jgi:hypothetical protein
VALPLLASLAEGPPAIQIQTGKVIAGIEWLDPSDDNPNRRTAKVVKGFHTSCPLRWSQKRHGARSCFSAEHVMAADRLWALFDGARIGFSALRDDWKPVSDYRIYRPPLGPTTTALRHLKCRQQFAQAWSLFDDAERALLAAIVIGNTAVTRYAAMSVQNPAVVKERLVKALDALVEWFDLRPARARSRPTARTPCSLAPGPPQGIRAGGERLRPRLGLRCPAVRAGDQIPVGDQRRRSGLPPSELERQFRTRLTLVGRLSLEDFIAFGEGDPGLLASRPDVRVGRSHDVSSSVPARTRMTPPRGRL